MGVFIYNGLKSAHMVPVPAREQGIATIATVVDSCWDVDMWITPFPSHPDVIWRKNMKCTAKFALFYYSVKTKVTSHRDALLCEPCIVTVSVYLASGEYTDTKQLEQPSCVSPLGTNRLKLRTDTYHHQSL